jgi:hypothetical protein
MDVYHILSSNNPQEANSKGYSGRSGSGIPSTVGVPNKFGYAVILFTLVMIVYIVYRIRKDNGREK